MTWHGIALHIADRGSSGAMCLFFSLYVKRFLHRSIVFEWIPLTAADILASVLVCLIVSAPWDVDDH